jgi:hypothetical protein
MKGNMGWKASPARDPYSISPYHRKSGNRIIKITPP